MFAPNLSTHQLADSVHHERQAHAARLHRIVRDRQDEAPVDVSAQRRLTARRLVASLTAVALTLVIAAAAAAQGSNQGAADMAPANGGSLILIR